MNASRVSGRTLRTRCTNETKGQILADMNNEVDYAKYTEAELLQVLRSINVFRSGSNFQRLKAALEARGYMVTTTELGFAVAKLRGDAPRISLDASVRFSSTRGALAWMEPSRNDFRLVGVGRIQVDNATVRVSGHRFGILFGPLLTSTTTLDRERIFNVETQAHIVRFEHRMEGGAIKAITLLLDSPDTAERLTQLLPSERTADFHSQLSDAIWFDNQLRQRSGWAPVTTALVAANILVFVAMCVAGAGFFAPVAHVHIAWGSNFGPYTTDGEWWRLLTSGFIHFGIVHLIFNMWALAATGPLVERLYGSVAYASICAIACIAASLTSTVSHPDVNSAGASGIIFGIYGALLAAMLRGRQTIPRGVVVPLRTSAIVFSIYTLATGFLLKGVDNAAHLGGLAVGYLVGLAYARPEIALKKPAHRWVLLTMAASGCILFVGVALISQRSETILTGNGLFWHTQHWIARREAVVSKRQSELWQQARENKLSDEAFADAIDSSVLPTWREAEKRLSAISLTPGSPVASRLDYLRSFAMSRRTANEMCVAGARSHNKETLNECVRELARGDAMAREMTAKFRKGEER
ncbi:MAG: rhomboid family intramembrane serine protease [Gammaproteobacteria bacterium]